jgi:hypothetical protein
VQDLAQSIKCEMRGSLAMLSRLSIVDQKCSQQAPIIVFLDWKKTFHVHVDASTIALGPIMAQLGAGDLDHPIAFASRKLSE